MFGINLFSKKWQKFLFFQVEPKKIGAMKADINITNKKIKIRDLFYFERKKSISPSKILEILSSAIVSKPKSKNIIFFANKSIIKSTNFRFLAIRENPASFISQEELENTISDAVIKMKERELPIMSRFFNEESPILAKTFAHSPKIDSNKVINPIGFPGRRIEINFKNNYTMELFWEELSGIVKNKNSDLISFCQKEIISDAANNFLKKRGVLVEIRAEETIISILGESLRYSIAFDWGFEIITREIKKATSLSDGQAEVIKDLYLKGGMSEKASKWFDKIFLPEIKMLQQGIILSLTTFKKEKIDGEIFLEGEDSFLKKISEVLPKLSWGRKVFPKKPKVSIYPKDDIFGDLGIDIDDEKKMMDYLGLGMRMALVDRFVPTQTHTELNKSLRRFIRWFQ